MTAADFWIDAETVRRPDWGRLAAALGLGLVLGGALTALAVERLPEPAVPVAAEARTFSHPGLDREWRGYRTPVDVDRMFPRRGR